MDWLADLGGFGSIICLLPPKLKLPSAPDSYLVFHKFPLAVDLGLGRGKSFISSFGLFGALNITQGSPKTVPPLPPAEAGDGILSLEV